MKTTEFNNLIPKLKLMVPGGMKTQMIMAPESRRRIDFAHENTREAAVVCLFHSDKNENVKFVLIKRASYDGTHSSQIGFPGGKSDFDDKNLWETGIRETEEEIGISRHEIKRIKTLSDLYIPPSRFHVTPYMAFYKGRSEFIPNHEVESIIPVKLSDLLDERNAIEDIVGLSNGLQIKVPCFQLGNQLVWGATAMILSEIKEMFREMR